jgi:hypothetical protein
MEIKEFIAMLLCSFAFIVGYQLGIEKLSFWLVLLIAFAGGVIVFFLLSKINIKVDKK